MTENQFSFAAGQHRCVATRSDRPWGHGIEVSIFDVDDPGPEPLNIIYFLGHPEFAGYDQIQTMNTEQMVAIAARDCNLGSLTRVC